MSNSTKTYIELSGMTCPACEKLIGRRLSKIEGVSKVQVNLKGENAQVDGLRKITEKEIKTVLEGTQYQIIKVY